MQRSCRQCRTAFEITDDDLAFLEKVSPVFSGKKEMIPPPTLCPSCRQQKRICWRNERSLYKRDCDLCRHQVISIYAPEMKCIVYCPACFWSDCWNPLDSSRNIDWNRPFFDQFQELLYTAPLLGLINMNTENSEYCNRIYDGRNNYLSFIVLFGSEGMLHSFYVMTCKDCCDVSLLQHCELCYEVTDGENCYACSFSNRIRNCSNSWFLEDCMGCQNCFQCKNLHQKSYCIRNKQHTKEEYEHFLREQNFGDASQLHRLHQEAKNFFLTLPYRAIVAINCENCTGANIFNCKDCHEIYDFFESERMRYCTWGEKSHDCMDCYGFGVGDFCYECGNFNYAHQCIFTIDSPEMSDNCYCTNVFSNSSHCFGCVGLKKASYCIFNKQYSKTEYEDLVPRLIEHMRQTGEWGQFYPPAICPLAYNDTTAQEYFPLSEQEARDQGFLWRKRDIKEYQPGTTKIPENIADVPDAIIKEILACEACGKNYKIVTQELAFYRSRQLPIPNDCPDCRHIDRLARRPSRKLWQRTCIKCSKKIMATYQPSRPEIVYCEECYRKEVY